MTDEKDGKNIGFEDLDASVRTALLKGPDKIKFKDLSWGLKLGIAGGIGYIVLFTLSLIVVYLGAFL